MEVYAWEHIITRICKQWYPNPSSYEWDPASPRPNYLKAATLGPLYVGNGQVINFDFKYGVNDWGLQAAYDWQTYYVPQSQELCIADLKTLIQDMHNSCLFGTGYDTSQDLSGSGQPKWYTFMAS